MRAVNGEPQVISFSAVIQRRRGKAQPLTRAYPVTRPAIPSAVSFERGVREGRRIRVWIVLTTFTVGGLIGLAVGLVL